MVRFSILDPTGNITALVTDEVAPAAYTETAAAIMAAHPEVEQVGYVRLDWEQPSLCMAGGEFCGNATMSAAALYADAKGLEKACLRLRVSGAEEPVEVALQKEEGCYTGKVVMPPVKAVTMHPFACMHLQGDLPVVEMQGISHAVVEEESVFYHLLEQKENAEKTIRQWCRELAADGLGLMFLKEEADGYALQQLVYIPSGETVFWESSCASGSACTAVYLERKNHRETPCTLKEPGGSLTVSIRRKDGRAVLGGHIRLVGSFSID